MVDDPEKAVHCEGEKSCLKGIVGAWRYRARPLATHRVAPTVRPKLLLASQCVGDLAVRLSPGMMRLAFLSILSGKMLDVACRYPDLYR